MFMLRRISCLCRRFDSDIGIPPLQQSYRDRMARILQARSIESYRYLMAGISTANAEAGTEKQEAIRVCSKVFLYISFLEVNIINFPFIYTFEITIRPPSKMGDISIA